MDFFKAFPKEKKTPGLKRLQDGRWQMTRVVGMGGGSEVKASHFPVYMTTFMDMWTQASEEEKSRITNVGIDPDKLFLVDLESGGEGPEPIVTYVFEEFSVDEGGQPIRTLIGGDVKILRGQDGFIQMEAKYMEPSSISYVMTAKGSTATVSVNDAGSIADHTVALAREEASVTGTIRGITQRYIESGVISDISQPKNGGALIVREVTVFNQTIPASAYTTGGAYDGFVEVVVNTKDPNGVPTYIYTMAKGAGIVKQTPVKILGNKITITTKYSLTAPSSATPYGGDLPGQWFKEEELKEGYKVWTEKGTVIDVAIIESVPQLKEGGLITETTQIYATLTNDSVPAAAHLANEIRFFPSPKDEGYTLYTSVGITINADAWSNNPPYIGAPRLTGTHANGAIKTYSRRRINADPAIDDTILLHAVLQTSEPAVPALGYTIYQSSWIGGQGDIDAVIEPRSDGSRILVLRAANAKHTESLPSPDYAEHLAIIADGNLIDEFPEEQDGWTQWSKRYYAPPPDTSYTSHKIVQVPGVMGGSSTGVTPSRDPQNVSLPVDVDVTYHIGAQPDEDAITLIEGGVRIFENAVFNDGYSPGTLGDSSYFANFYAPASGAAGTGGTYRGRSVTGWSISFFGRTDQFDGSTKILESTVEPYFRVGGVTCWKKTKVSATMTIP